MTDEKDTMTGEELGEMLLKSVKEMKAGKIARVTHVDVATATKARQRVGASQKDFAHMLGVSVRTLQEWEQGRREPTGAAQTLLKVAVKHPDALRDIS